MLRPLAALFIAAAVFAAEPETSAIIQPIPELKLTNGTVFRNVTIVRYEPTLVVLKSSAGTGPISYTMIPEPLRSKMLTEREGTKSKAAAAIAMARTVSGHVYVTTAGAGAYKFSETNVAAYPQEIYNQAAEIVRAKQSDSTIKSKSVVGLWINALTDLGATRISLATTNAEGKYQLALPNSKPVFLLCSASRLIGSREELTVWIVPNAPDLCDLNSENHF